MIDHLSIIVADFDRSRAFYKQVLAPLGDSFLMQVPAEYTGGVKVGSLGKDSAV